MSHPVRHFRTITRHRHIVFRHCLKAGIPWRGIVHDLSKYSPTEFIPGARYYTGHRSPTDGERRDLGYSMAWMHHKGRNRHHYEFWTDYSYEARRMMPVKMPLVYVIEMFCDRVAASKVYNGAKYSNSLPLEYFERGTDRTKMHPDTARLLGELVQMLAREGEDRTFNYIRRTLLPKGNY